MVTTNDIDSESNWDVEEISIPKPTPALDARVQEQEAQQQHTKSKTQRRSNYELLEWVLRDKDDAWKARFWQIMSMLQVEQDDPILVVLAGTGQLQVILERAPEQFTALFAQVRAQVLQDMEVQRSTAIEVNRQAISSAVTSLIRKTEWERATHSWPSLLASGAILLTTLLIGAVAGWGFFGFQQSQSLQVQRLSVAQVKSLQWATSEEGQFARQLMDWNQHQLKESWGTRQCVNEAQTLGITLKVGGKSAKSGFCVLWVTPPGQRQFGK